MAQIKIYGIRENLTPIKKQLSDTIHSCIVEALQFPQDKRAHRFFCMDKEDFIYPSGRTDAYTIIEISMIEGRSVQAKKFLIKLLFERIQSETGIAPMDIEICIYDSPAYNWGFRGFHGDEVQLNYRINV